MRARYAVMCLWALALSAGSAQAGPDESMRVAQRMAAAAKQKLVAAQSARSAERSRLMAEHMKMMDEVMVRMIAIKPVPGMTMQEHEQWIAEHQALMQQVMEQMAGEQQLLRDYCAPEGR